MPHFGAPSEKVLVNGVPGDQVTDRHGEQTGQRLRVSVLTHPPAGRSPDLVACTDQDQDPAAGQLQNGHSSGPLDSQG